MRFTRSVRIFLKYLARCENEAVCERECLLDYDSNIVNCPCYSNCKKGCRNCKTYSCDDMKFIDSNTDDKSLPYIEGVKDDFELTFRLVIKFEGKMLS